MALSFDDRCTICWIETIERTVVHPNLYVSLIPSHVLYSIVTRRVGHRCRFSSGYTILLAYEKGRGEQSYFYHPTRIPIFSQSTPLTCGDLSSIVIEPFPFPFYFIFTEISQRLSGEYPHYASVYRTLACIRPLFKFKNLVNSTVSLSFSFARSLARSRLPFRYDEWRLKSGFSAAEICRKNKRESKTNGK